MDDAPLNAEIVAAAQAWAAAKREWEAGSRELARPSNYGELKGNVRKAERRLMNAVQGLELQAEEL